MKFSIITVCRNCANALQRTLRSIREQSYPSTECLVIDGDSRDGTRQLLRAVEPDFGSRLRWVSEPDEGIYHAMNKGLTMAQGDIVGFLNADDCYLNQHVLTRLALIFRQYPDTDAAHANLIFIDKKGKKVRQWYGAPYRPGAFQQGWMPAHPTFYCRRTCYEQFGGFDTDCGSAADFELMLRFIEKHGIRTRFTPDNIVQMRIGGTSNSGIGAVLKNSQLNKKAFQKNGIRCPWHYSFSRLLAKFKTLSRSRENH